MLRDGTAVTIRPMRADDEARLVAFHERLSSETQRLRFFGVHPHLSAAEVTRFTHVDGYNRVALVAELDDDIVGVARYDRLAGTHDAEAAFVVQDDMQGRGLGGLLLQQLVDHARANGLERLVAETLPENRRMLRVFHRFGPDVTSAFRGGVVHVVIPLASP